MSAYDDIYLQSGPHRGYHPSGDEEVKQACQETHPKFTITCQECESENVYMESTVGFSVVSGKWGHVSLICHDCGNEINLDDLDG